MSCQMIRAREWDQMVQSGRVREAVAPAPDRQASVEPAAVPQECWPDLLDGRSDLELLALLDRARRAERQLWALVTDLTAELARRTVPGPLDHRGPAPRPLS